MKTTRAKHVAAWVALALVLLSSAGIIYHPVALADQSGGGDTGVYVLLDLSDARSQQPDFQYGSVTGSGPSPKADAGEAASVLPQTGDASCGAAASAASVLACAALLVAMRAALQSRKGACGQRMEGAGHGR